MRLLTWAAQSGDRAARRAQRFTPEPVALTTTQVAGLLGLSRSTVTLMIGREELASVKVGGSRRVERGCSVGSVAHVRRTLSAALNIAERRGHIVRNPVPARRHAPR